MCHKHAEEQGEYSRLTLLLTALPPAAASPLQ